MKPKKAQLRVDGQVLGQARDYNGKWDLLYIEPGEHVFSFEAEGHMTLRLALEVKPGSYQRIDYRLQQGEGIDPRSVEPSASRQSDEATEPAPPEQRPALRTGLLSLRVQPDDAAVYLDGEFLARADELRRLHGAIPVASGRHTIEVVRPGFESASRTVDVGGSEPVRVEVELKRKP